MRKAPFLFTMLLTLILSGCSLLGEVNDSLEYVDQATEQINTITNLGEEAPQMLRDAASDPEVKKELENQLNSLREDIAEFNEIEPPAIAEDLHQQLVNKNEELEDAINTIMENGEIAIDKLENVDLENIPIFNTINEFRNILNQIEELGL
jgi:PBP1b-binding outer membrane lipoprotein LpoB